MRFRGLVFGWLISFAAAAQGPDSYLVRQTLETPPPGGRHTLDRPATALSVTFRRWPDAPVKVVAGRDTFLLLRNPHADVPASDLIVFPEAQKRLTFIGLPTAEPVELQAVYAPPLRLPNLARNFRPSGIQCEKPPVVPVSVWRTGLTPPRERPAATTVRFLIVHHEAGSNTATDFVNVVRNIYVFHTQSNGWNDVGYNFLIAPDGTIFEGRDGQGLMDGDNVLGAHFCGTNSGTMGVCLLGNYMTAQPRPEALTSLASLLAWKMRKERLTDPFGSGLHASSGKNLMTISGHRDGTCSTECPGINLYAALPPIREAVGRACGALLPLAAASGEPLTVYPNPAQTDELTVRSEQPIRAVTLTDLTGRSVSVSVLRADAHTWKVGVKAPAGLYLLRVSDAAGSLYVRKVSLMTEP